PDALLVRGGAPDENGEQRGEDPLEVGEGMERGAADIERDGTGEGIGRELDRGGEERNTDHDAHPHQGEGADHSPVLSPTSVDATGARGNSRRWSSMTASG